MGCVGNYRLEDLQQCCSTCDGAAQMFAATVTLAQLHAAYM